MPYLYRCLNIIDVYEYFVQIYMQTINDSSGYILSI